MYHETAAEEPQGGESGEAEAHLEMLTSLKHHEVSEWVYGVVGVQGCGTAAAWTTSTINSSSNKNNDSNNIGNSNNSSSGGQQQQHHHPRTHPPTHPSTHPHPRRHTAPVRFAHPSGRGALGARRPPYQSAASLECNRPAPRSGAPAAGERHRYGPRCGCWRVRRVRRVRWVRWVRRLDARPTEEYPGVHVPGVDVAAGGPLQSCGDLGSIRLG